MTCACGCGRPATILHHCVRRQEIRRYDGSMGDERNLIPLAHDPCHEWHHNAARRLRSSVLPDSVFEFAAELMGPGRAANFMIRHYSGAVNDKRVLGLLDAWDEGRAA